MSFSWHQDGAYVHARVGEHPECVTVWCALDDVHEANGTIYILPVCPRLPAHAPTHTRAPRRSRARLWTVRRELEGLPSDAARERGRSRNLRRLGPPPSASCASTAQTL